MSKNDMISEFFIFAGQSVLSVVAFGAAAEFLIWCYDRNRRHRRINRYDLVGKRVLITGASSGLGRALAREFYLAGAKIILAARSLAKLQELCDELKDIDIQSLQANQPNRRVAKKLIEPTFHYLDLADNATISEVVTDILEMTDGQLDVLVNNAGMSMRGSCVQTSMVVHRQLMEVNYFGHVELTRLLVPALQNAAAAQPRDRPGPVIVCIGSVQGRFSIPYRSAYAASKHAFHAYFECLRAELAAVNPGEIAVRVLMVTPGYMATNLSMNAISGDGSPYGKLDDSTKGGLTPEDAAKEIMESVIHCHREVIMSTLGPRVVIALRPWLPWLYFWWTAKRARKEKNQMQG